MFGLKKTRTMPNRWW